jgi:hypothetical protein
MARTNAVNFSGALQFPMADAATDLFRKEDVQTLAKAVDGHDHSSGKGLVLAPGIITSAMIADGTIQGSDIATGAIGTTQIADQGILGGDIASGTITSVQLAGGAAHVLLGSYQSIPSFSSSSTGTWIATPIAVTAAVSTVSGAYIMCFGSILLGGTGGVGTYARLAILIDGNPILGSQSIYQIPAPGIEGYAFMMATHQPSPGNHTWAIGVLNTSAGTLSCDGATAQSMVVVENRR